MSGLTRDAIERALIDQGVPPEKARWQADHECGLAPAAPRRASPLEFVPGTASVLGLHQRRGDELRLVLAIAPRTKKNGRKGGFGGIKQGPAYRRYRDAIISAIAEIKASQSLPLPEQPYNIAVTYYVDRYGKTADKCGLDQGLYDALENAGVITNDWYFRTDDGTRIVAGDPHPRVELTITPIGEVGNGG